MFLSQADHPQCDSLPTEEDQEALWENLDNIDVFTVGYLPSQLALDLGKQVVPGEGIADILPLLLTAVKEELLTY